VDVDGLKELIKKAKEEKKKERGIIKPGERIKFD